MYSQNNEEEIIVNHFGGRIGQFLDVGAYNGITFSNTHKLVELGWDGVCVEPSPSAFVSLVRLYKDNSKVKLVNCAIDKISRIVEFYDAGGDAVSSMDLEHKAKWEKFGNSRFSLIFLKTITFKDLFDVFRWNFDFINLDVENKNFELFQEIDFQSLAKLKAICVEHDGRVEQMCNIVRKFGFRKLAQNGENLILVR